MAVGPLANGQSWQWVQGRLQGKPFVAKVSTLKVLGKSTVKDNRGRLQDSAQVFHLQIAAEDKFMPDNYVLVMIQTDPGKPLSNQVFRMSGAKFGTEQWRKEQFGKGNSVGRGIIGIHTTRSFSNTKMHHDELRGFLQFGKSNGRAIAGNLDLTLKDGTRLKGGFVAKIEKF